jgi:hypothetical protein
MAIYVFGYGSLMNMSENTELDRPLQKTLIPVSVKGMKRAFNVNSMALKDTVVLGVRDVRTSVCNGVLFKVTAAEFERLETRENLYVPKELAPDRLVFTYSSSFLKKTDKSICFYPLPRYVLTKKQAALKKIKPAYLRSCLDGAEKLGEEFLADFLFTTT